jgi:hypothetical protein
VSLGCVKSAIIHVFGMDARYVLCIATSRYRIRTSFGSIWVVRLALVFQSGVLFAQTIVSSSLRRRHRHVFLFHVSVSRFFLQVHFLDAGLPFLVHDKPEGSEILEDVV